MLGRNRATVRDARCLLLLAALSVGFLWRSTLAGKAMLPGDLLLIMEPWRHHSRQFPEFRRVSNPILDAVQQFYPWRKFAGESLRSGEIPLWNPYELCGNPFVGNNQSAVFYPETWLHAVMPTERALGWATALYFFSSGSLMFWFLRVLALRRAACLLGAIAFMFNGFVVGWLCFPSFRSVPGWLPGMLVGVEFILAGRRARGTALCGLCTGMQFLAGNLHISLYVLLIFASYVIFRVVSERRRSGAQAWLGLSCVACALVMGGMLAASQLLPTLELAGMSSRSGGIPYSGVLQHGLAPQALLTGLMPDLFGNPVDYNHWGAELGKTYRAYTESAFYVGVLPLLLAPLAFWRHRARAGFWLAVAIVGALLATGTHVNALLYYLVPSFKALSGIGRAVVMIAVAVPILGAHGFDALLARARTEEGRATKAAVIVSLIMGLVGAVVGLAVWTSTGGIERALPGIGAYTAVQIGRFCAFLIIGAAGLSMLGGRRRLGLVIVLAALTVDLYLFVDKFTPATDPDYLHLRTATVDLIRSAPGHPRILSLGKDPIHRMAANVPMAFGLEDVQGSDSLEIGTYRELWKAACTEEHGFAQPDPSLPLMEVLGVRFVHSSYPLDGISKLRLVSSSEGYLYENDHALPRAFTVPGWRPADARSAEEVATPRLDPAGEVPIAGVTVPGDPVGGRPTADVRVAGRMLNEVQLEGDLCPGAIVVLADTYFPGWRAFQDGTELPVMRAYHALRAVETVGASGGLTFVYLPQSFRVGGYLSLLALAVIVGLARSAVWKWGQGR